MDFDNNAENRIISSRTLGEDSDIEYSLRPRVMDEYLSLIHI